VQVTVTVRHGDLDDPTQQQLQEKAETLLRFFDRLTSIGVTADLNKQRTDKKVGVEIIAKAEHKHEFVAREFDEDPLAAFNLAADKIKMQLRHYKERLQDHRRDPSHNDTDGR
jgi:putative sigma-54 modulation protein